MENRPIIRIGQVVTTEHYPNEEFIVVGSTVVVDETHQDIEQHNIVVANLSTKKLMAQPQSASIFEIKEAEWPVSGPDFNQWNKRYNVFCLLQTMVEFQWYQYSRAKYVTIRADIRANNFLLMDRDGHKMDPIGFLDLSGRKIIKTKL